MRAGWKVPICGDATGLAAKGPYRREEEGVGNGAGAVATPGALRWQSEAPFTWQPGLTRHRQRCQSSLEAESWQSIFEPWSGLCFLGQDRIGSDRCLGLLTRAVACCAAGEKEPSGRPVSSPHFLKQPVVRPCGMWENRGEKIRWAAEGVRWSVIP